MKIGLTLSGGGARGVAHIGVIKALEELGLEFSIISGTSAGSIIGAMYAYGYKPLHILEIIKEISIFKSVRPAWNWSGLLTMDGMKDLLFKYMPNNSFEKLKIPLTIAATEIRIGEIRYFSEGELIPAIMASCTIPAVFSPMVLKDGLYVDGGVFDNLPAKAIRDKCDFLIGSHCNQIPKEFDPKNMKVVIERSLLMAINANTQISKGYCDVLIEPTAMGRYGSFEIGKAQEIFDFAYSFTKDHFKSDKFEKVFSL
jgi:NTE family protein